MAFATYKLTPRDVSLDKSDIKRLVDFVINKTNEAKEIHKANLNLEGQTDEQKADIYKTLDEAYRAAIFIYGTEGEEFLVYDSGIFDAPEFPDLLTRVAVDTFIPFRNRTNLAPFNGMRIDLDFSSSKILDWHSNLSGPTPNASEVVVQGHDDGWRAATLAYMQKLFRSRKNHRAFLHAPFTYDVYLWLLFAPIFFCSLILSEYRIDVAMSGISTFLRAAIYVYTFFVFANLYRILLGYVRWTFQSVELTGVQSTQQKHRRFWAFLISAIILPIILSTVLGR